VLGVAWWGGREAADHRDARGGQQEPSHPTRTGAAGVPDPDPRAASPAAEDAESAWFGAAEAPGEDLANVHPLARVPFDSYHPRDKKEWQGMLVNLAQPQVCEVSAHCGDALACRDGRCGPCVDDGECEKGESCVLDHCVLSNRVACRTREECRHLGDEALCILNGLTGGDPRANADTSAHCSSGVGGSMETETAEVIEPEALGQPGPATPGGAQDGELARALWDTDAMSALRDKLEREAK
jgi:hypothetical protein